MKKIKATCNFEEAEKIYNRLINKYNTVNCIKVPQFDNYGLFIWEVK